jgi:hypothetical protein
MRYLFRVEAEEATFYTNAKTARRASNKVANRYGIRVLSATAIAEDTGREGAWQLERR